VRPQLQLNPEAQAVFLTGYGEAFHPNALGCMIRKYIRAANIAIGGSHLLRHTCATHLLEGGADIRYIQKLLGHASLETTAIYTEMNVKSLRQVFSECHPAEKRWREKRC
jgi:integrase/recombinase XerD